MDPYSYHKTTTRLLTLTVVALIILSVFAINISIVILRELSKQNIAIAAEQTKQKELEIKKQQLIQTEAKDKFTVCIETVMTKAIEAKKSVSFAEAKDICSPNQKSNLK